MMIRYSPIVSLSQTTVEYVDANTLNIDGELYNFPVDLALYDPCGPILEAYRDESGEIFATILLRYTRDKAGGWEIQGPDGRWPGQDYESYPKEVLNASNDGEIAV